MLEQIVYSLGNTARVHLPFQVLGNTVQLCFSDEKRRPTKIIIQPCPFQWFSDSVDRTRYVSTLRQNQQERNENTTHEQTMSVSSILKIHFPPCFRAKRWLYRAILRPPRCRGPVGEGAKRNKTMSLAERSRATAAQGVEMEWHRFNSEVQLGDWGNQLVKPFTSSFWPDSQITYSVQCHAGPPLDR